MTANKQVGKRLSELARLVLNDKSASAAAKAVAASVLASATSKPSKEVASKAAKVLRDKDAKQTERAVAASALVVRPRFRIKGRSPKEVERAMELALEKRKA